MSLEKINLPGAVLAGLYKDKLVVPAEEVQLKTETAARSEAKKKSGYRSLGENGKRILIMVNYSNIGFLPENDLEFLTKMLAACKLNLGDVAIVNHSDQALAFDKLKKQFNPVIAIAFGFEPEMIGLPLNFPHFQSQIYDSCTHLYVPALDDITAETEKGKLNKSKLWVSLRNIFNV